MKELSIEYKAKRYDEAYKFAENIHKYSSDPAEIKRMEEIFPELKESEDEKIRQFLIQEVTETSDEIMSYRNMNKKDVLAWLEKQGEQKPGDNIVPKFKVGDIIRHKEQGFTCKITAVDTEYRVSECCGTHLPIEWQDAYELVEQKPAEWDEEDIVAIDCAVEVLSKDLPSLAASIERLKSIRPQNHWKPSEEQMKTLNEVINYCANGKEAYLNDYIYNRLIDLRDELNKL